MGGLNSHSHCEQELALSNTMDKNQRMWSGGSHDLNAGADMYLSAGGATHPLLLDLAESGAGSIGVVVGAGVLRYHKQYEDPGIAGGYLDEGQSLNE